MDATLSQVDFRGATLDSVDFRGAKMTNVAVGGADLRNTFGLTFVMLQGTIGDDKTLLPKGIDAPKRWSEAGPIERSFALFHPPLYTGVTGPQDTGQDGITTRLLFPYVTNQAGFDTGISLSNISDDPFGSAKNDGICTVHYYGSLVGGGVAPKAQTTLVLHAGEQAIFTLSGGGSHGIYSTPGFQGYIIAECRFKAAGLGFVSDTDAKRVGSCYVAQRL